MHEKLVFIKGVWKFVEFEEPSHAPEDPQTVIRNKTFDVVKNTLGLLFQDDQLRLGVDNAYPLLKTIGLNPQSERVVDLVREASIENYGEIKPEEFESVVLGLVQEQDVELWEQRMEEKEHLHRELAAAKAKAEAEKMRVEQERLKAGFVVSEAEVKEDAEREEMMKKKENDLKEKMQKEDELFDNMKMAFRFIDHDGDGVISTSDLYTLMMGLGEMLTDDELFSILNMADLDCDGKVTYDDFRKFLLPQCGDETLITAPRLLAQSLLNQGTEPAITKAIEDSKTNAVSKSDTHDNAKGSINVPFDTEQASKTVDTSAVVEDTNKNISGEEGLENAKPETTGNAAEQTAALEKRRSSMLWGYMNRNNSTDSRKPSLPSLTSEDDSVFESNKLESEAPEINLPEATQETKEEFRTLQTPVDIDIDTNETPNHLGAIREEDEHSNCELGDKDVDLVETDHKIDTFPLSAIEHKRKLFSRQSSSASLKTKVTDSFGDSGIETLDTVNCSEIREQPDVFDIDMSDEETDDRQKMSTPCSEIKASPRAIYDVEQDDEDMVDAHHVHESLSRVSSSESLSKLDDLESEMPTERVRNYVNDIFHIELPKSPRGNNDGKKIDDEKLAKAEYLQSVILNRTSSSPNITVSKSSSGRPMSARRPDSIIPCAQVNIDLTLDTPPKADIRTFRKSTERSKSATTPRESQRAVVDNISHSKTIKHIRVIDLLNGPVNDENVSPSVERSRWPVRLLTRPRSPVMKRPFTRTEKSVSLNLDCIPVERQEKPTFNQKRAKSANPLGRSMPHTPNTSKTNTLRPKSASLSNTSAPISYRKSEPDKNTELLAAKPFANADLLYPNKSMLTMFHHGFRSIWPIGRKINLIQNKRPFEKFEMNSYSRAIERQQYPFKGNHNICIQAAKCENAPDVSSPLVIKSDVKSKCELEDSSRVTQTTVRKLSLYIEPNRTPRSVR
ncbi:uncharacterized protein LOC127848266 isoform X1 [Dreissena polymorpha]|uniref:uncharacterized protein LOC127848266 isoform X1 n=1 Tax=Dreissena polymorpha TaxID=45954 RepID=UPI0022645C59|nr:uncharacterized protein LOC127848266 isoform X1 [Dreissena polymorpha]